MEWLKNNYELLIIISCLMIVLIVIVIFFRFKRKKEYVLKHGFYLRAVKNLNLVFKPVDDDIKIYHCTKSKKSLQNLDFSKILIHYLEEDEEGLQTTYRNISYNKYYYDEYVKQIFKIFDTKYDYKSNYRLFFSNQKSATKFDKKLAEKEIINNKFDTKVVIIAYYISPKGKKHYTKKLKCRYEELDEINNIIEKNKEYQASKEYQRSIMTDSLRYEILRRDEFRCQLCGATAQGGAKLHVDHIIPVSKGGKTEKCNLRTLCDQCNLGKKDKIE